MQRQTLNPGEIMNVPAGVFFRVAECIFPVNVKFRWSDGRVSDKLNVARGYAMEGRAFDRAEITTETAQAIGVLAGIERETYSGDAALVETTRAQEYAASTDVTITAGTSATISAAANARRRALIVKNNAASAGVLRIGGAGVAANAGLELAAGQFSPVLECYGQLYGYAVGGNCTVSLMYLRDAAT